VSLVVKPYLVKGGAGPIDNIEGDVLRFFMHARTR
jgi:hypothetical protein